MTALVQMSLLHVVLVSGKKPYVLYPQFLVCFWFGLLQQRPFLTGLLQGAPALPTVDEEPSAPTALVQEDGPWCSFMQW